MVEAPVQPVFSSDPGADELPAYRPVRVSAFVTLGLGILSGCVVFSKVFLLLPVLTLIVAAFALRPSVRGMPVGRPAAYAGVVLAVFFGSWGWVQETTREKTLRQHASRFAEYWVTTAQQGEVELALELTKTPSNRQSQKMPLETYYQRNESAREKLQEFLERPLISTIVSSGESLQWEIAERPRVIQRSTGDEVTVRLKETTGTIDGVVEIDLLREPQSSAESAGGEWVIIDYQHRGDQ